MDRKIREVQELIERFARDFFIRIPAISRCDLAPTINEHGDRGRTIHFARGLNILYGRSGTGKTSILRQVRSKAGNLPLPDNHKPDLSVGSHPKSSGEALFLAGISAIEHCPKEGCVLIDDLVKFLDTDHQRRLIELLNISGKQIIMTTGTHGLSEIRSLAGDKANYIDVEALSLVEMPRALSCEENHGPDHEEGSGI